MNKDKIIREDLLKRYCQGECSEEEFLWLEQEMERLPYIKFRIDEMKLEMAKAAEFDSFREFFDFFYPKLMAHACRYINDESAKDVVQEVFISYWEKKDTINVTNIQSYLYRWVQNSCLNILKHNVMANDVHTRIAEKRIAVFSLEEDNNDSLRNLYTKDVYDIVETSLQKLPPRSAEACRLFLFKDLAQKEISAKMNISLRTVETHIHRAFSFLRKDLSDLFFLIIFILFNK